MNEPTQEQIKEFWEWCGFEFIKTSTKWGAYTGSYWISPCGPIHTFLPDIDLNNLFKYAVPKLGDSLEIELFMPSTSWLCQIKQRTTTIATSQGYHKDPALALFWAIWEMLHK